MWSCASCLVPNSPLHKFCGACGTARSEDGGTDGLLAPQLNPQSPAIQGQEGERKQVTVLFADIEGSLELFSNMDPEDTQLLLDPVLKCMIDAVESHGGLVARIMGDGVMAVFGVPIAQEQHAVLGCCAAVRMQEGVSRLRESDPAMPRIRVGIHSGEVVVRTFSKGLHLDYVAVGVAARMEKITEPGSIALTSDTLLLAEGYVTVKTLGFVDVKGLSAPIEAFRLLRADLVRSKSKPGGFAPFTGRNAELELLVVALRRASSGQTQVVTVQGEPGVGKSRLVHEFLHSEIGSNALVMESNTAAYAERVPYLALSDLLRTYLQIEQQHSVGAVQLKAVEKIRSLGLDDAMTGPILHLLDVLPPEHPFRAVDPLEHRQRTCAAIEALLRAEARIRPVIVLFEDVQWHDSLTRRLLDELATRMRDDRVLLVATHRPEHFPEWRKLGNSRELKIPPLTQQNLAALVYALLGTDPSLEVLQRFLLDRAGGNPFFLEELIRTLVETGVVRGSPGAYRLVKAHSPDHVPPTVQAVIAARIDRLTPDEKSILQVAAVIGNDVPLALLEKIQGWPDSRLRAALGALQAAEFMRLERAEPDAQYSFKHALTHEVAYSGLLKERRREIHARIVSAMEMLYANRLSEQVERLADHALRGRLPEKALVYLHQAGRRAAERDAYREAVALFERALEVLTELPASREHLEAAVDLRLDMRNVLQPLGDRARIARYLREAEPLAEQLGDARRIGWVQAHLTEQCWMLGLVEEALVAGDRALSVASEISDTSMHVVTNLSLGLLHHTRGSYGKAMEYFEWNFDRLKGPLAQQRFGMFVQPSSFAGSFLAWSLAEQGEFERAREIAGESVEIADASGHAFSRSYARLGAGVVALRQGTVQEAIAAFEIALADPAFSDSPLGFAFVASHLGYARSLCGQASRGISVLEKTVQVAEAWHFVARHSLRLAYLSEAYMLAGRLMDAENVATRALALALEHDERANEAYALRVVGEIHLRKGASSDAASSFEAALRIANELRMRPLAAHCHRGLSAVPSGRRDKKGAAFHADSGATLAAGMGMTFWDEATLGEQQADRPQRP